MSNPIQLPRFIKDLENAVRYLSENAPPGVAEDFVTATEKSLLKLNSIPGMGTLLSRSLHPRLKNLRKWPVDRFQFLIFYRDWDDHIEAVRLLHGARDIDLTLIDEE